jgi:methyl-accepting chemotaxis protein
MSSARWATSCEWKTDVAVKARDQEPESPVEWLENELRETKARLHKVEGELDQALKQVWSLEADVRRVAEAFSVSGSASAALAALREDVRQLHSQIGKAQDRHSALANRTDEIFRQRQTETGRDRQELGELARQVASLTKTVEHFEGRVQLLEEVSRRVEEGVAGGHLADQALERQIEDLSTRTTRAHEAALRIDHDVSRIASEIEKTAKDDDAGVERARVIQVHVRRLSERIDKLESIAAFPEETRELLQRATFEREQLAQRLLLIERLSGEVTERLNEFLQSVARLDQRTQAHGAELVGLTGQLSELSDFTRAQLKRASQVQLRQRRRQHEALAQEIKELGQDELQGGD